MTHHLTEGRPTAYGGRGYSLTRKQARLLRFIEGYMGQRGYAPSIREMGAARGRASPNAVHYSLNCLIERGRLRKLPNRARAIEPTQPPRPIAINGQPYRYIPVAALLAQPGRG